MNCNAPQVENDTGTIPQHQMFDIGWKLPSSKSGAGDSSLDDDAASDAADSIDYQMNLRTELGSSSCNTLGADEELEKSDDESDSSMMRVFPVFHRNA